MIKKFFNKIFRKGITTLIIFMGFTLSFLMFLYYDASKRLVEAEKQDGSIYRHRYGTTAFIAGDEFDLSMIDTSDFNDCDIIAADLNFFVGNAEMPRMSNVVITDKPLIYPIVKGHYPRQEELDSGESCVVLGRGLKRHTYSRDGEDYIKINKEEYCVTGYVAAAHSPVLDNIVLVYYKNIGKRAMKELLLWKRMMGIPVLFQSNSSTTEEINEKLSVYEKKYNLLFNISAEKYQISFSTNAAEEKYVDIAAVIYVFSLILIVITIYYWYTVNRKEYAIRRAYGYSYVHLVLRVIGEFILYIVFSIIITEAVLLLTDVAEERLIFDMMDNIKGHINILGRYIFITLPIIALAPVHFLTKTEPVTIIRRE